MERRLFGYAIGDCDDQGEEGEGGMDDNIDEVAERRGATPKRGDGGFVVF
jgi:hypothetical protein